MSSDHQACQTGVQERLRGNGHAMRLLPRLSA